MTLSMWHVWDLGWRDSRICKVQMTPSPQTLDSWVLLLLFVRKLCVRDTTVNLGQASPSATWQRLGLGGEARPGLRDVVLRHQA